MSDSYRLVWLARVGDRVEIINQWIKATKTKPPRRVRGRVTAVRTQDVFLVRATTGSRHLREVYRSEVRPLGRVTALPLEK